MTEITNYYKKTEIMNSYKTNIKMGAQQSYKNLTMFPLLTGYSTLGNFLTMFEPLSKCNPGTYQSTYNTIRNRGNDHKTPSRDYIEQFARVDGQIGAIFLINGKFAGIVCLHGPEVFKKSFIRIVECYSKKAEDEYDPTMDLISPESAVINFLKMPIDSGNEIQLTAEGSNQNRAWTKALFHVP